jgi:hypothetical protein
MAEHTRIMCVWGSPIHMVVSSTRTHPNLWTPCNNTIGRIGHMQTVRKARHVNASFDGMWQWTSRLGLDTTTGGNSASYRRETYFQGVGARPHFCFWPPRKQRAILWTLAHLVWYRMQGRRRQSLIDYIDFMRRARWKAYLHPKRRQQMGNDLVVL